MPTGTNLRISAAACIWCALLLLVLPLQWVTAAFCAALFHELCHFLAIRACGSRVSMINIGGSGAMMDVGALSNTQELICTLAGPVGGLLLLFIARWFPRLAICGLFHSLYNLLPVYPMDGGRALRCVAFYILHDRADNVCLWVERIFCVTILLLGVYASWVLKLGPIPVIMAGILLLKANHGKIPCKAGLKRVQ